MRLEHTMKLAGLLLAACAVMALATADPAEARRRNGNGNGNGGNGARAASCCKVLGIYQPRLTHTSSKNERFFTAVAFSSGGAGN